MAPAVIGSVIGDDGLARPPWAAVDPMLREYYDTEWGLPVRDEQGLYERISLEAFQAGLSWATILRKRPAFRAAFHDFHPETVAAFTEADVERLLLDAGIVRNRLKIRAAITNAQATIALRDDGGLVDFVWAFQPESTPEPTLPRGDPHYLGRVDRPVQGAAEAGFRVRRAHHDVCPDGSDRHDRHASAGQPPPWHLRYLAPLTPHPAVHNSAQSYPQC